jgi:hypothetical protein
VCPTRDCLDPYARFLACYAPAGYWGSIDLVERWAHQGGLHGATLEHSAREILASTEAAMRMDTAERRADRISGLERLLASDEPEPEPTQKNETTLKLVP